MDAVANLPAHQRQEFVKYLEEQQMKDSLRMYNNLVEICFEKCVMTSYTGNFSTKHLTESENKCIAQCADKFMKGTQRVGFRFAEYQQAKASAQQQK